MRCQAVGICFLLVSSAMKKQRAFSGLLWVGVSGTGL